MKKVILNYIQKQLKKWSSNVLRKFRPDIIGITGSCGKSSTKEAVASVLKTKFTVLASPGNYNTEIGVPLTILEQKMPRFFISWPWVMIKAFFYTLWHSSYYEKLVLELAADKPGDIKYLTNFIRPKVAILTSIGPSHLERFKTVENVALEKSILLLRTKKDGILCLNYDDPIIRELAKRLAKNLKQKIIWYGTSPQAQVWASSIEQNLTGIKFNINYHNDSLPIIFYNVLGKHLVYPALAAVACGIAYNISLGKAINALKTIKFPKGRMHILDGIRESKIIDDSYNANPLSMKEALATLQDLNQQRLIKGRKIGVLGTMNELGSYEKRGHQEVGERAAKILDYLITIGHPANTYLAKAALEKGFPPQNIFRFNNSLEAGKFLKKIIREGDIILVKGSQNNVRTEWVIEQIMEYPERARELLVRQEPPWKKPKDLKY